MSPEHVMKIDADGNVTCLYSDALPLREMGTLAVERASEVEYDNERGGWLVMFPLRDGATIREYLCLQTLPAPWATDPRHSPGPHGSAVGARTTAYHRATVFASREDALGAEVAYLQASL